MLVTKKIEIDAGHRVPQHTSRCKHPHGHRYSIEVGVDDKVVVEKGKSNEGMVIDFGELKEIMLKEISNIYDHSFIMSDEDELAGIFKEMKKKYGLNIHIVTFIPTAENLAMFWYRLIETKLLEVNINIKYLKVWETPTSTAVYTSDDNKRYTSKGQTRLNFV